jgi:hypothetical protein
VNDNEPPEAQALWIMFAGREWIVMHYKDHFQAIAADNRRVRKSDIKKLFRYLVTEGFINEDGTPPEHNHEPANI